MKPRESSEQSKGEGRNYCERWGVELKAKDYSVRNTSATTITTINGSNSNKKDKDKAGLPSEVLAVDFGDLFLDLGDLLLLLIQVAELRKRREQKK